MTLHVLNTVPRSVKVKRVIVENDLVKTFVLDHSVGAQPGQFCELWIPRVNQKPFSVAMDTGSELYFTVAAVGDFSRAIHELKEGDFIGVSGPFGTTFECGEGERLAFLAGGYGAAPLYFFAHEAIKKGCTVDFIVGARREDLLLYTDRIPELDGVTLHVATDDGSAGHHGYNTQVLDRVLEEAKAEGRPVDCVYTVGPEIMMLKGAQAAEREGSRAQVSVERYMKCGFGICGNCVVDGLGIPTCIDGPVMDWEQVKRIEDFGKYHRDAQGKKHSF